MRADTPVYAAMSGGTVPADLDVRAQALKLEHLLNMSSGLDCDDADPASPGNEDKMQEQTEQPDWYRYTLDLKMLRPPGEKARCTAASNPTWPAACWRVRPASPAGRAGGRAPGAPAPVPGLLRALPHAHRRRLHGRRRAAPPARLHEAGPGACSTTAPGRAIASIQQEWSDLATKSHYYSEAYKFHYGYLWWGVDYPYQGRTIRAYFASGNGGQISIAVPELQLAMAFHAGNYNDSGGRKATREYVPQFILPAVQ